MIRLLSFLLHGCFHVWEEDRITRVHEPGDKGNTVGFISYRHCKKCGRPRRFNMF